MKRLTLFLALVCLMTSLSAVAKELTIDGQMIPATISVTLVPSKSKISGLSLDAEHGDVKRASAEANAPVVMQINGLYPKGTGELVDLGNNKKISISKDGKFSILATLVGPVTLVELAVVDPKGKSKKQTLRIDCPEWAQVKNIKHEDRRLLFSGSLGLSSLNYAETGLTPVKVLAVTAKLAVRYRIFVPNWDTEFSVFYNILPLSVSPSDKTMRFLGVNLRIGYMFPFVKAPWSFALMGGMYYTQMFVTNNAFGYGPLLYPQFYPVVRRTVGKNSIYAYFKYVPLSRETFGFFKFARRDLGLGGGWVHPLSGTRSMSVSLDYSSMKFDLTATKLSEAQSITASMGMGF